MPRGAWRCLGWRRCRGARPLCAPPAAVSSSRRSPAAHVAQWEAAGWAAEAVALDRQWRALPAAERARVDALEPFDEFEEFDVSQQHYVLVTAARRRGGGGAAAADGGKRPSAPVQGRLTAPPVPPEWRGRLSRRAHCATVAGGRCYVFGGFAEPEGGGGRRRVGFLVRGDADGGGGWEAAPAAGDEPAARMHATLTAAGHGALMLHGGRAGPLRPCTDTHLYSPDEERWRPLQPAAGAAAPPPRWRHSATAVRGESAALLFGGRDPDGLLDAGRCAWLTWSEAGLVHTPAPPGREGHPAPRHSHGAAAVDGSLLIYGGYGRDHAVLSDAHVAPLATPGGAVAWRRLEMTPPLPARYGHACAAVDAETVLCVGGVGHPEPLEAGTLVLVLRLGGRTWSYVECSAGWPLLDAALWVQHAAVARPGGGALVLGGGSGCFAFGEVADDPAVRTLTIEATCRP